MSNDVQALGAQLEGSHEWQSLLLLTHPLLLPQLVLVSTVQTVTVVPLVKHLLQ